MLALRNVFDKYRVPWRDHGANCSRGNVNIPCPFCRNDPSYHMSVSEDGDAYYCFRNPEHAGRSLVKLFKSLRIPLNELPKQTSVIYDFEEPTRDYKDEQFFVPATDNPEAIDYILSRNFTAPHLVCKQFNLKVALVGEWAGRLIIPLTVGWTGRSMRRHIEPRYKANTSKSGFFLHTYPHSSSVIIFEGALDAMRIASISTQFDVIGRCGNKLSPALQLYLAEKSYHSIYQVPDNDVPYHQYEESCRILAPYAKTKRSTLVLPPAEHKDLCAASELEALQWLVEI